MEQNVNGLLPYEEETPILPEDMPEEGDEDYGASFRALLRDHPELRQAEWSEEVFRAYADGGDWNSALARGLPKDAVERHNTVTAAHAPVRGVTAGGGTGVGAEDPFLQGFDSVSH